ncbi:MAG TPA: tetratricopeptide repeat protein [Sedimentisphaerales bacterium]|nr:tetratricopeptide repeat protein [Sedimentisphaerales bacterium]
MTDIRRIVEHAVQHHQAGRLAQAEHFYNLLLQIRPDHPFGLHSLAMIASQTGRSELALDLLAKAIKIDPENPQFHNTRGIVLEALGRPDQALEAYQYALALKPDYAEACHNMAIALIAQADYAAAVDKCTQATSLMPDSAQPHNTMGFALEKLGRYTEAVESYKRAVQLAPDYAEACNHLGVALNAMGRYQQALQNYRHAIRIDPDYAEAHWNLSLALLLTGNLAEGFEEYQWRRHPDLAILTYPHRYDKPRWDRSDFTGKTLLVHYEQGFGDTIQFIRYLPMVKARGGTVILEVRKPLLALLRAFPGVDELVEASPHAKPPAQFDLHVSLMDLPGIFETTLANIPADVPYLHADPAKADYWRKRISCDHFNVGIVWSGSSIYERNHLRSCRLDDFLPLAAIEGVKLYSLQKGGPAAQLNESAEQIPVVNLEEHLHDFSDTAAVIENLDLVISVDTCVPHLAAAMGKPTWTILCAAPAWQWLLDRSDSPWYPTMRLFRQTKTGQWADVFHNVAEHLTKLVAETARNHSKPQLTCARSEKVPVIIPAYRGKEQLEKCVAHLEKQTLPVEIFVRDNNEHNVYFTAAINEGIKRFLPHDCPYIIMLNQDMYLEPDAVEQMLRFMDAHPKCGIGAPLQLSAKIPDYVVHAGCFEAFPTGQHRHGPRSQFTKDEPVFWVNGACMILRKKMITEIGLLDPNFILVGSDSDYCFTARARAWQVWTIAAARGIHEGGVTGRIVGNELEILKLKDMTYFANKWLTGELYKRLSCEGKQYTPEMVAEMLARIKSAMTALESAAPLPAPIVP